MTTKDYIAVVWTRLGEQPVKMGTVTVTDQDARFTYEDSYVSTGMPGLGLVYPADKLSGTIVRPRSEYFDLHPPLQSLIPPRSEQNFQRALLLRYLNSININPKKGFETDWEMLVRSGHGAIGHLDVFASDEAAIQWYSTPSKQGLVEIDDKFGFSLKEFMTWFDGDAESLISLLGPTPSVGGAIPKIPLSIPSAGWDGRIGLPTRFGDTQRTDIILKLENTNTYPGIVELEMLALEIHKQAGFDVPRYWPVHISGLDAIAIERFDRTGSGSTVFQETLYSVMASGSKAITHHYSATYDKIAEIFDNPYLQIVDDAKAAKLHLLDRLLLAMLTGNGDLHLENLSFSHKDGVTKFSKIYDPTPMRAYKIHDLLFPPGMTFGDFGALPNDRQNDTPVKLSEALLRFTKKIGISKNRCIERLNHMLAVTSHFEERVYNLKSLPEVNKKQLCFVHNRVKKLLMAIT